MIIDPEIKAFIPPLSDAERAALEDAIVNAGRATDPLTAAVLDDATESTLLDGHNRHEICERHGLPYTVINLGRMTRADAKAWMFAHQVSRRNLSRDQIAALAAAHGAPFPLQVPPRMREMATELAASDPGQLAKVIASGFLALRWGEWARKAGKISPRAPRPPQGPSDNPRIPEGHELRGQSTLRGPDGEIRASWDKTGLAGNPNPEPPPPDFAAKKVSTFTAADGSERGRWTTYSRDDADMHEALMAAWDRHAESYAGFVPPAPAPARTSEDTLALYPIGDYHLGMLAWYKECGLSWDLKHGKAALALAVAELVRMAPDSDRAIIANLGDFLHAQDDAAVTPGHGNRLDVDGRHAKVADAALVVLVGVIDATLRKHRHVTVRNLPGNHDPRVAAGLARELGAWYRNEPRVTIADAYAAHQYESFGKVLLGFHHGDRTPSKELPGIMAVDQREAWGTTEFRYWHLGHVHHKSLDKEHPGCIVETHRILPPGDAWHKGRYRAGRGMSVITYDRDYGEIGRSTVGVERIAATLAREVAA